MPFFLSLLLRVDLILCVPALTPPQWWSATWNCKSNKPFPPSTAFLSEELMMTAVVKLELGRNHRFLMAILGLFCLKHCTSKVLYIMVYKLFVSRSRYHSWSTWTHFRYMQVICHTWAWNIPRPFFSVQGAHRKYVTLRGLPWEVTPIELVTVIIASQFCHEKTHVPRCQHGQLSLKPTEVLAWLTLDSGDYGAAIFIAWMLWNVALYPGSTPALSPCLQCSLCLYFYIGPSKNVHHIRLQPILITLAKLDTFSKEPVWSFRMERKCYSSEKGSSGDTTLQRSLLELQRVSLL